MLIGIISDTHDRLSATKKACSIFKDRDITTLLHAGDFIAPFVIPLFKDFKVYGTFGNNDGEKKGLLTQFNTIHAVVTEYFCEVYLDSLAIAVTHGHIPSLLSLLVASSYDVVVTGHTHSPEITRKDRSPVVINPGECCGYLTDTSTVAVFDTGTRTGEIIEVI
jgi:putative phosphoesterase